MSHMLSLFGPVSRLLRRRQAQPVVVEPESPEDTTHLDKIVMLFARRPESDENWCPEGGRGESFRIMTREMSPDLVLFSSEEKVRPNDELEVRFLLSRGFTLTVRGTVDWVMQTAQGYSGQLNLKVGNDERGHLRGFLKERQALPKPKL